MASLGFNLESVQESLESKAQSLSERSEELYKSTQKQYLKTAARTLSSSASNPLNATATKSLIRFGTDIYSLDTITNISISSYRQQTPVRNLGFCAPAGYARGSRTVAGTMVFTLTNNHPLIKFLVPTGFESASSGERHVLPDSIPPFDMAFRIRSEEFDGSLEEFAKMGGVIPGQDGGITGGEGTPTPEEIGGQLQFLIDQDMQSVFELYGVNVLQDSVVFSVDDTITEVVISYVARDYTPVRQGKLGFNENRSKLFRDNIMKRVLDNQDAVRNRIEKRLVQSFTGLLPDPADSSAEESDSLESNDAENAQDSDEDVVVEPEETPTETQPSEDDETSDRDARNEEVINNAIEKLDQLAPSF